MLKILRKKGVRKKILWVIVVIIIISFGFFGTAYLFNNNAHSSYAGKIFNQNISGNEFQKANQQARIQAILRYGKNFEQVREMLDLDTDAWDRLILLHEAKKRNIQITDQEVINTVKQYPFFQRNGQFDILLYNDILRYVFHIDDRDFEENTRESLKIGKLFDQTTSSAKVSETEIFEAYKKQNEKAQVSYVLISANSTQPTASTDENKTQEYFNKNKLEFLMPMAMNVDYIFLAFPETADEVTKNTIRDQADKIFEQLRSNPDIKTIASQNNLKVQTSGFFSREQPIVSLGWSFDLLNKIFQLEPNSITEPFEAANGIYLIKIKQKKEAYVPSYDQAKEKIKAIVAQLEASTLAQQKAQKYLQLIKEKLDPSSATNSANFAAAAKSLSLDVVQTPIFNRGQYLPNIGLAKEFQEAAFMLNENNKISGVVSTEKGYCILHLDSYIPADQEQFKKEKETLSESILNDHKNEIFNEFMTGLRLKAKLTSNLPKTEKFNQ